MEEGELDGPHARGKLVGEHILAATLNDGRVGGDVGVGSQSFHAVAAQTYVASKN